jgi:hypothetical protein
VAGSAAAVVTIARRPVAARLSTVKGVAGEGGGEDATRRQGREEARQGGGGGKQRWRKPREAAQPGSAPCFAARSTWRPSARGTPQSRRRSPCWGNLVVE